MTEKTIEKPTARPLSQRSVNYVLAVVQDDPQLAAQAADELEKDPRGTIKQYFALTREQQLGLNQFDEDFLRRTLMPVAKALREDVDVVATVRPAGVTAAGCSISVSYTPPNPSTGTPRMIELKVIFN
ncbi:hypothetical protein Aple_031630 [Acrocarpospora pleiomorpha]|uniref:Uncharacterized protein n=1 Tax=Acrocarpospora pleiomorpha TaxID=90975 RepID=A0A5M3XF85_9ACTN|nr:hypothetical protein [Acrocarpospora pleiomorpha]GES20267.1 hypothetical protein Aple_031630 [Acrocarpospora pleiomorpha]